MVWPSRRQTSSSRLERRAGLGTEEWEKNIFRFFTTSLSASSTFKLSTLSSVFTMRIRVCFSIIFMNFR